LGSPLFSNGSRDVTFLYGFLKDFLTLRRELRIQNGTVLIGRECWADTDEHETEDVATLLKKMGVSVLNKRNSSVIDICRKYIPFAAAIYSRNEALLQFARPDLCVVRDNEREGYDYLYPDTVAQKYGVVPARIATFLTLTRGPQDSVITRNQAVRLIEAFGTLEAILASRSSFSNPGLRARLTENEAAIIARYQTFTPSEGQEDKLMTSCGDFSLHLDTEQNTSLLHSLGMHSVVRLLGLPCKEEHSVQVKTAGSPYEIMDTEKALNALSARLLNTQVCAIDTESSGRDPHSATIFGIAFSANSGWSCYVPLLDHDLKGVSPRQAMGIIRRLLEDRDKKFIGHNIKYDYLLLRRNGIHLKSIHFDTMLAAFECYGDLDFLNLGFLSKELLGKAKPSYKEILGKKDSPWDIPLAKLADHACRDAETTFQLYRLLQKEMASKGLTGQYFDHTLPPCKTLGDLEYRGVRVNNDKLNRFRDGLVEKAKEIAQRISGVAGRDINIASDEELKHYLLSIVGLSEWGNLKGSFTAFLEHLAINYDVARLAIQYRRLLKEVHSVDAIIRSIRNGRVFPIFSQVKSKSGFVTAKQPDILDAEYLKEFSACFDRKVRPFFRSLLSAINRIQTLSRDKVLKKDMSGDPNVNSYIKSHPELTGVDSNGLFLQMITGASDSRMVSRFLIDRRDLALLRSDLESRYGRLFSFLNKFQRDFFEKGFAEIEGKRRYLVGLKSPNLEKRRKASQLALEWLLGQ
jgi:DNA polymerase-1